MLIKNSNLDVRYFGYDNEESWLYDLFQKKESK